LKNKIVKKKLKNYVIKLSKSCQKVVKSCQKVVKKLSKVVKKLSQKVVTIGQTLKPKTRKPGKFERRSDQESMELSKRRNNQEGRMNG
jgi:uncharacterized protein Yka (UPF0111/DUF47 family)